MPVAPAVLNFPSCRKRFWFRSIHGQEEAPEDHGDRLGRRALGADAPDHAGLRGARRLLRQRRSLLGRDVPGRTYYAIRDVSRRDRLGFVVLIGQLVRILPRERPDVVITTGSAPCLFALGLAKTFLRASTIWIDSIANVERLSSSGAQARRVADVWLTQWEHLGPRPGGAGLLGGGACDLRDHRLDVPVRPADPA